ncbi:penicillin-binding protein activator [Methylovorus sp. MP688]|uniref:penicillin-binding protein activator n=1 Tax=Methylovorus sp. (strain MP688) TaxID=887061 RepID=UPI0001EC4888|nr:penicillin-binding protein activator [Methylovorus sp. MP688]ADQ85415.1 putative lipoprotein-like protein [Methylovorus sp. MP688]
MIQRLLTLLFMCLWLNAGPAAADTVATGSPLKKTPETQFSLGMGCLKKQDIPCAQLALASIPAMSPYAKVLSGNIAASQQDYDQALLILLPLQADKSISAEASASLHTSLALAYENQDDPLRALEQYVQAQSGLAGDALLTAQKQLWQFLSRTNKVDLIAMRGNITDTTLQGWIDLALAGQDGLSQDDVNQWRNAYPDHVAMDELLAALIVSSATSSAANTAAPAANTKALSGQIALILPFSSEAYYPASDAIERGFVAAQTIANSNAEVKIYATTGGRDDFAAVYQQAVSEGANYIVGPLTRDEVTALSELPVSLPTVALNQSDLATSNRNIHFYGLAVDSEAQQVVRIARDLGMQTATIVGTESSLSNRMIKTFGDAWIADGGQVSQQFGVNEDTDMNALKSDIQAHPTDMIFLATTADNARQIRPALDAATPTFGLSHIYAGVLDNADDAPLLAVRFVDMPWLLSPDTFAAYKPAAQDLPSGEMQRWFALGADAFSLLQAVVQHPGSPATIKGLSGTLRLNTDGSVSRELAVARFGRNGITVERLP